MFRFEKFHNQRQNINIVQPEPKSPEIVKKNKKYELSSEEDDNMFDFIIDNKPNNGKMRKLIRQYIDENHE